MTQFPAGVRIYGPQIPEGSSVDAAASLKRDPNSWNKLGSEKEFLQPLKLLWILIKLFRKDLLFRLANKGISLREFLVELDLRKNRKLEFVF